MNNLPQPSETAYRKGWISSSVLAGVVFLTVFCITSPFLKNRIPGLSYTAVWLGLMVVLIYAGQYFVNIVSKYKYKACEARKAGVTTTVAFLGYVLYLALTKFTRFGKIIDTGSETNYGSYDDYGDYPLGDTAGGGSYMTSLLMGLVVAAPVFIWRWMFQGAYQCEEENQDRCD